MVLLHLAEGQSGLALANRLQAVTLVVDVLRASTTLAVLASRGPRALYVTREVERARKLALERPGTVLAGERGGLPPEGFALGNSPLEALGALLRGKRVVFTSTTGAQRLAGLSPDCAALVAAPINARAAIKLAFKLATKVSRPIVVLAAGSEAVPPVFPLEDWAASALLASRLIALGCALQASEEYDKYQQLLATEGLLKIFERSEHGSKLISLGLERDLWFCAQEDLLPAVPVRSRAASESPEFIKLLTHWQN